MSVQRVVFAFQILSAKIQLRSTSLSSDIATIGLNSVGMTYSDNGDNYRWEPLPLPRSALAAKML
jgi:hypothetical protein